MVFTRPVTYRGVTIVVTAVMSVVIVGFAALAIDIGRMYMVRTELQRTADAAAMAGASVYLIHPNPGTGARDAVAQSRCQETSLLNFTLGEPTNVAVADIVRGMYDFTNPAAGVAANGIEPMYNACQVTMRCDGTVNSTVPFFFGSALGESAGTVTTQAIAVFDTRVLAIGPALGLLTPFVIEEVLYNDQLVNGPDNYSYDSVTGPEATPDNVPEIHLFPSQSSGGGKGKGKGNGGGANAPGNFGLLNIANPNQGTPLLGQQIENGVTGEELEIETGYSELSFFDESGNPQTYEITGTPGIKAGLEPAVETRFGDIIGFFLYTEVVQGGSNATYTISAIRFGRVMHVELQSGDKKIVVQPIVYSGPGVRIDASVAPVPNGMVGRLVLVN